jgi:acetoacetate decarboxylase
MGFLILGADVDAAAAAGQTTITLAKGSIVTPQARERAQEIGVSFSSPGSGVMPEAPARPQTNGSSPAAPAPIQVQQAAAGSSGGLTFDTEGWGHPIHAPLYFPRVGQRVIWHKALNVTFRADPAVLATFLPRPLELAADEVVAGVTEHYQPGHGLPVQGASVDVRARYKDVEGRYRLLVVNSADEVQCANREEFGMPLIMGEVKLRSKGNTWWGYGRRGGDDVIKVSMFPERVITDDSIRPWDRSGPMMLMKCIPSADPARKPWRQILALRSEREGRSVESSIGRGSVEFGPSAWGIDRIKPLEILKATYNHFEGGLLKSIECLWEDRPDPIP